MFLRVATCLAFLVNNMLCATSCCFPLPNIAYSSGNRKRQSIRRSVMPTMVDITLRVMSRRVMLPIDFILFRNGEPTIYHAKRDAYQPLSERKQIP